MGMHWEGGMSLGEIIDELKVRDYGAVLQVGFGEPDSYRGYYECLMFKPKQDVKIGDMLGDCQKANGATYEGYKGGEYTMDLDTECYIAEYGNTGLAITKPLLHGILNNLYTFDEFMAWL